MFSQVCSEFDFTLVAPPAKYCTDNGVMVAWNGVEKFRRGLDLFSPLEAFQEVEVESRSPMGVDVSQQVWERQIKCKWIKIL